MTQEDFNESKEKFSNGLAEAVLISFKEYDWDKFVHVLDQSTQFGSTRKKYDLYKDNAKITPYLDETGNYKFYKGEDILMFQYQILNTEYFYSFLNDCQKDVSTRWNIWAFTLYPSGEYESEFIWYSEAYLDTLKTGATSWFRFIYEKACERVQDRCGQLPASYPALVEMTVTFDTLGISQPALFHAENNPKMTFKLHLEQLYFFNEISYEEIFAEYNTIREPEKGDITRANQKHYKMMNEGELKGVFPRWNKLTFTIDPNRVYISSEEVMERLKFEWLTETEE